MTLLKFSTRLVNEYFPGEGVGGSTDREGERTTKRGTFFKFCNRVNDTFEIFVYACEWILPRDRDREVRERERERERETDRERETERERDRETETERKGEQQTGVPIEN